MKITATTEKITIKWFAILSDGSKMRMNRGFIHNAFDVTCSCGWETSTGGAVRSYIQDKVDLHKVYVHNYTRNFGA
jgi:hypothetical protein